MAAASEVMSGKEPRGGGLGSPRCRLSVLSTLVCSIYFTTRLALAYRRPECLCGVTILAATPPFRHVTWIHLPQRRHGGGLNYLKPCSGLAVCCCCDPQHCQLAGLRQGELFQTGVCWQVGSSVQRDRWANPAGLGPD